MDHTQHLAGKKGSQRTDFVSAAPASPQSQAVSHGSPQDFLAQLHSGSGNSAAGKWLQAKLRVGAAKDVYEQEADHVADQVMRMPDPALQVNATAPVVQRVCAACEEKPTVQRACAACEEEETAGRVQRKESGAAPGLAPLIAPEALSSGGQPLDAPTRAFMEPRFGHDLSQVRLHTGSVASGQCRELNAQAFTFGNHIFVSQAHYAPETSRGKHLLAHELAHTIQQRSAPGLVQRREVCDPQGVCRSEPDTQTSNPASAGALAPVSRPGDTLDAPGDCTWAEHIALQAAVEAACYGERRCTQNDDCPTIWQRIQGNADCIKARSAINMKCYRGGNAGHIEALNNAVNALNNCWAVYNRRCQPERPPVPVPVPVPEENRRPVVDRGFMERMAALTGLTGTALVLYLIVSEGSRLFPPRNLIPVP